MIKLCKECKKSFDIIVLINGKRRYLDNRSKCLDCMPWGTSPYRRKLVGESRSTNAIKSKEWYRNQKEILGVDPIKARKDDRKEAIIRIIGTGCQICGYNKCIHALDFHHIEDKLFAVGHKRAFQGSAETLIKEIRKCIIVCNRCHTEIHHNLIDHNLIKELHNNLKEVFKDIPYSWPEILKLAEIKPEYKERNNALKFNNVCRNCSKEFKSSGQERFYCSNKCSGRHHQKIDWPDNLPELAKKHSMVYLAKQLGVSDKAISRRLKNHHGILKVIRIK